MPRRPRTADPEASLRGQIAAETKYAHASKAQRDANTRPAREAALRKLEDEVDPNRELDPAERGRRVRSLRRAKMAKLSLLALEARRTRAAAAEEAELDALIAAESAEAAA